MSGHLRLSIALDLKTLEIAMNRFKKQRSIMMSDKPILVCTSVNDKKAARNIANNFLKKIFAMF
ncbi:MAG: hypothetical protein Ct9H90mP18_10410 [Gammaproteobacteria bacterium]|nr:MAG: hypothetical protein Ct9H90mP18_10410 [Gammaproteobacteria bacterium]